MNSRLDKYNKNHAAFARSIAAGLRERAMACPDAETRREMLASADRIIDDLYAPFLAAREAMSVADIDAIDADALADEPGTGNMAQWR